VANLLFKPGAAWEQYERPQNTYDFKNKVLTAVKVQYERVSGPCIHSSSNNPGNVRSLLTVCSPILGISRGSRCSRSN
jgi:hypothetical protein